MKRRGGGAVVIGSSMAGLLAARVLSDHFDTVTVVERDALPDEPRVRKGAPQGAHAHVLLARGGQILDDLFPGLRRELVDGGAIEGGTDEGGFLWYHFGGYKQPVESNIRATMQTRPFLEARVRARLQQIANVRWMNRHKVSELVATDDRSRIVGVRIAAQDAADRTGEELPADLAVDASGRGSKAPEWLAALGYEPPTQSQIRVGIGYATRTYRRTAFPARAKAFIVSPHAPREKRFAALLPVEGDRWICSLAGWHKDHAPTDAAGFLEFARSLPVSDVYDVIREAEPLTDVAVHKFPASVRHHYDRLARRPDGLVVVGDAVCSFNPAYAQGMTVAALEAMALDACLREGRMGEVQKRFAKIVDVAWMLSAGEDFRYPETDGVRAPGTSLVNAYVGKLHRLVHSDASAALAFYKVMHFLEAPTSLFHPRIAWRVLTAGG